MKKLTAILLSAVVLLSALMVACGSEKSEPTEKAGIILPTDAQGELVYPTDAEGYPVYPTDAQGEIVYATDAEGRDIVAVDSSGSPITGNHGTPSDPNTPADSTPTQSGAATEPTQPQASEDAVEDDIPVIIATIPDDDELYELPILD